jgi:catechol 2,3-dioxygenase-like lactoylglutathione lyase family enzyme
MGVGLTQIKHVKLPVTDLRRSASWYQALFDLELVAEYVEQGEVRGVSLLDRDGGFEIALRQREYCTGQPRLAGFDVFALRSPTEQLLAGIAERCDRLGILDRAVGLSRVRGGLRHPGPGWNAGSNPLVRPAAPSRLPRRGVRRRRAAAPVPPAEAGSRRPARVARRSAPSECPSTAGGYAVLVLTAVQSWRSRTAGSGAPAIDPDADPAGPPLERPVQLRQKPTPDPQSPGPGPAPTVRRGGPTL